MLEKIHLHHSSPVFMLEKQLHLYLDEFKGHVKRQTWYLSLQSRFNVCGAIMSSLAIRRSVSFTAYPPGFYVGERIGV